MKIPGCRFQLVRRLGEPAEPFNRAQRNRGVFTIFSDALQYDVPAHAFS